MSCGLLLPHIWASSYIAPHLNRAAKTYTYFLLFQTRYIFEDEQIVPMLEMIRKSGRSTFLVTNSLWDYTHVVMNYLCGKCGKNIPRDDKWLQYFDVVIVGR